MRGRRGSRSDRAFGRRGGRLCAFLLLLLLAPLAAAHGSGASLPGDTLARATPLGAPPARAFEAIDAGEAHYYRVETGGAGEVRLRLFAPPGSPPEGLLLAVLFGPDLPNETPVPAGVERPEGMGALVFPASGRAEALDARVPARRVVLLDRALALPDAEHVLVLVAEGDARVAVFVEAGAAWPDWFLIPSLRGEERAWAGAPAWLTYAAALAGVAPVAVYAWRANRREWPLLAILGVFAAALFAASTLLLLVDAARAGGVAPLLVAVGLALPVAALLATRMRPGLAARALLAAVALVGFVAWSGFLWAPVAALAGALLPEPARARD